MGIDLSKIVGTGPDGRIVRNDVLTYQEQIGMVNNEKSKLVTVDAAGPIIEKINLSGIRKVVSHRVLESYVSAPHIYLETVADVTDLLKLRNKLNDRLKDNNHITFTDLVIKATYLSISKNRILNSTITDDVIYVFKNINIGIATWTEGGLIVPVIRDIRDLTLLEISMRRKELIEKARESKITLEELEGGTFTITNLGMFAVNSFLPIINLGQAAILAVGEISRAFIPDGNDNPVIKSLVKLVLGVDHRIAGGVEGAKFLSDLKEYLELPLLMMA